MARAGKKNALKAPPVLANPEAAAKLATAAAAVGLTPEELADLAVEAGIVSPQEDGITERYTLKDLGQKLWGTMQGVPRTERAEWFQGLVPTQRIAVVTTLREQGFRSEIIGQELGLKPLEVNRIWNTYASELGSQVVGIRLDSIAGQVQLASERAQQMAMESGDHTAYWRIEKEKVQLLQSIGIVDQAIRRVEVTHKVDEAQAAEIEAIAALRNKQQRRKIEIEEVKQLDNQGDTLPEGMGDDYDEDD